MPLRTAGRSLATVRGRHQEIVPLRVLGLRALRQKTVPAQRAPGFLHLPPVGALPRTPNEGWWPVNAVSHASAAINRRWWLVGSISNTTGLFASELALVADSGSPLTGLGEGPGVRAGRGSCSLVLLFRF